MITRRDFIFTANGFLLATTTFIVCADGFLLACKPMPQFIVQTPAAGVSQQNLIGINIPVGGAGNLDFMSLPLFQNQVQSGYGFQDSTFTNAATLDASGWPTQDFGIPLAAFGANIPSWINLNSTPYFACGFTSKNGGLETITGGGANILNVVHGVNTTFDLQPTSGNFNFKVTGTTGGVTNVFAMLPAYRANTPVFSSTPFGSEFTNEAITEYKKYRHLRFMQWTNCLNNTSVATSATQRTWTNTKTRLAVSGSGSVEVYPCQWAVDLCKACNAGIWYNLPPGGDSTYIQAIANDLSGMPVGLPIIIEPGNELWNSTSGSTYFYDVVATYILNNPAYLDYDAACTVTGTISGGSLNTITGTIPSTWAVNHHVVGPNIPANTHLTTVTVGVSAVMNNNASGAVASGTFAAESGKTQARYLAVWINQIAGIFSATFGSRFGTDVKIIGAWQAAGAGTSTMQNACAFLVRNYGGVAGNLHLWAQAPYYNRRNVSVPGDGVDYRNNSDSVSLIEAELSRNATYQCFLGVAEGQAINAMHLGLSFGMYEGGWDSVSGESSAPNIFATIEDPAYTTVEQNYWNNCFNSGFQFATRFEGGVQNSGSTLGGRFTLTKSYETCIAGIAPRQQAMTPYLGTGSGVSYTRNLVSGSGSVVQCINYEENVTALSSTPANFNQNQFSPYAAPYNNSLGGTVSWIINCTSPGIYSLAVNFTTTAGSWKTNIEVGYPGVSPVFPASNVVIPQNLTDSPVVLGNVQLRQGTNYLVLGIPGTQQAGVTLGTQMVFS